MLITRVLVYVKKCMGKSGELAIIKGVSFTYTTASKTKIYSGCPKSFWVQKKKKDGIGGSILSNGNVAGCVT